jgi:hypothetical protein
MGWSVIAAFAGAMLAAIWPAYPVVCFGTILGAFAIAAAAARISLPAIAARLREWALITAAMAFSGILFCLYPLAQSALAMGLCSAFTSRYASRGRQ